MKIATAMAILALSAAPALAQFTNSTAGQPGDVATGTLQPGQTAVIPVRHLPVNPPYPLMCEEHYAWWINDQSTTQPTTAYVTVGVNHTQAQGCPMSPYTGDSHQMSPGTIPVDPWNGGWPIDSSPGHPGHDETSRRDTIIPGSCHATSSGPWVMQPGTDGQLPTLTQKLINPPGSQPIAYTMLAHWTCDPYAVSFVVPTPTPSPSPTSTPTPAPSITPSPSPS